MPTSLIFHPDSVKADTFRVAANDIRSWDIAWGEGAIYPLEMAAFLAHCRELRVEHIVESGRGGAEYSTRVLDKAYGSAFTSIDLASPKYPYAGTMLTGNTFDLLPQACRGKKNIALLIDGPKRPFSHWLAVAACCAFDIRLVALHNYWLGSNWGKVFARRFPDAHHYEERFCDWGEWKEWEKAVTTGVPIQESKEPGAFRSLDQSSLVIAVPPSRMRLFPFLFAPKGMLTPYHPLYLLRKWRKA